MIKNAVILAAGVGSRLSPITNIKPKCLVEVNGVPILGRMINNLLSSDIDKITIVCGYKADMIKEYCSIQFPDITFSFIENKDYLKTNNLYSLFLARDFFIEGSFLMNADIVFDGTILEMMNSQPSSCVAVDVGRYIEESMKVIIDEEYITTISKSVSETEAYGCSIDLYKFVAEDAKKIIKKAEELINDGGLNEWTEVALHELFSSGELKAKPLNIENKKWFEIDNIDDLLDAEVLFNETLTDLKHKKIFFVDNDGTLSVNGKFFDNSVNFINSFPKNKILSILTNNSSKVDSDIAALLQKNNIDPERIHVLISTMSACLYLKDKGFKKLYWSANEKVDRWLRAQGFIFCDKDPQAVLLCYDTTLTFDKLVTLSNFIRSDVPYYATHADMVCPVENGYIPDVGSFIEMLEHATGKRPLKTFGKPDPEFIIPILNSLSLKKSDAVVVGDRLYTDIELGKQAGVTTVLVLTGETSRSDYEFSDVKADIVVRDINCLGSYLMI